jgi:hypothetical protein
VSGSLAYRRHTADIWNGIVPTKYTRLLPYIDGAIILELGAAEGVQALLVADQHPSAHVVALELSAERHAAALALQARWRELGKHVDNCEMICGDIRARLELLAGVSTVVAARTIYHFTDAIPRVFAAVAQHATRVVLAGNPNRARWPNCTPKAAALGPWNWYAGVPGMTHALTEAGYTIDQVVAEGDPIVTGRR